MAAEPSRAMDHRGGSRRVSRPVEVVRLAAGPTGKAARAPHRTEVQVQALRGSEVGGAAEAMKSTCWSSVRPRTEQGAPGQADMPPRRPSIMVLWFARTNGLGNVLAFADVQVGCVAIRGVRLLSEAGGSTVRVAMPSRRRDAGLFEDVCFLPNVEDQAALLTALETLYWTPPSAGRA